MVASRFHSVRLRSEKSSLSPRMNCDVISTYQTMRFPDEEFDIWNTSAAILDPNSKLADWDWAESGWDNPSIAVMNTPWDFRYNTKRSFYLPFEYEQGYFACVYTVNLNASDDTESMVTCAVDW